MLNKLPLTILQIDEDGFHLLTSVTVNGKAASMLVDTGASRTVFDKDRFKNFSENEEFILHDKLSTGLGTNTMESHKSIIERFELGKIELFNYEVVLLDMTHVNLSYKTLELLPIDGVMGGDLLVKYNGVIDYENQTLTLRAG